MANATATITLNNFPDDKDLTFNHITVLGTCAISASPGTYPTGGLPISFAGAPVGIDKPSWVEFMSVAGGTFEYGWNKANGTIQIFADAGGVAQAAPLVELTGGTAIPAAVSGDTILVKAQFRRN